jgi:hypothetical protein
MTHAAMSRTWTVATIVILILCASARAHDAARIAAADDPTAAAVRAQLKNYVSLLAEGKWEAAADSCYCANDYERSASRARAELVCEYYACDQLSVKLFGVDPRLKFALAFPPDTIDAAEVLLVGDRALVTVNKDARYPLLRVNGTWRISIEGLAKIAKVSPSMMAMMDLTRMPELKKRHAELEALDRRTPDALRHLMKDDRAIAQAREAAALIPTPAQLDHAPTDATPAGALQRYMLYCAAGRSHHADATAMCYAKGDLAAALVETTSLYGGVEHTFYRAAVFRFGRAGADRILPRHVSPQAIDQSTFEENGDAAAATLPSGVVLPLTRIRGHWKLNIGDLCRISGNNEKALIQQNAAVAKIMATTAQDLLNAKYDSPEAVIAAMTAQGMRFPSANPKSVPNAAKSTETATLRE